MWSFIWWWKMWCKFRQNSFVFKHIKADKYLLIFIFKRNVIALYKSQNLLNIIYLGYNFRINSMILTLEKCEFGIFGIYLKFEAVCKFYCVFKWIWNRLNKLWRSLNCYNFFLVKFIPCRQLFSISLRQQCYFMKEFRSRKVR